MIKSYPQPTTSSLTPWLGLAIFFAAAAFFASTAYPTITWWDSSSYSLAAATLGVASPPGSLFLTLLGWPVAKLVPPMQIAHALNVLAGMIAAGTVAMIFIDAARLLQSATAERNARDVRASSYLRPTGLHFAALTGVAFGALLFASTTTLWDYAVRFTPYILSAFVTTVLLFVMIAWWRRADEPDAWPLLVLLSFLFGLDFSVHRTNALLIPGALAWVLIRKPSAVVSARTIVWSIVALAAGLSVQLLIMPIAAYGGSALNITNPKTLSRLWDYVTLKQLGGGFLLQLFPRKSGVWSTQVADVARILRDNFFGRSGRFGLLGCAPGVAAILGAVALLRLSARLGIAILVVLVIQVLATVLYFNIPAQYFRTFDRHYLPICVTIGILGACGLGAALAWATRARSRIVATAIPAIVCIVPIAHLTAGYHGHDASRRFFAHDWATNALAQLPPNAVYLTVGDNDTFPVMYVQSVEGTRRDVAIINTSVATLREWRERLRASDPTFPLSATVTTDSLTRLQNFARPIAFAVTGVAAGITGPKDSARFEGLHWIAAPAADRSADPSLVRRNLFEISKYRGYADLSVDIDSTTPMMAAHYYVAATELLKADRQKAGAEQCRADRDSVLRLIPPERIALPDDLRSNFVATCDP